MTIPEPTDVGPAFGGDQPVQSTDRTKVITLLDSAYAEGRLTPAEHEERTRAANHAHTFDDLVPLTRDLVPLDGRVTEPAWASAPASGGDTGPEMIVALFSGVERKGRWHPRRSLSVLTLFGGTDIDLTEAVFTDNVCEINVFCMFGGIDIRVPEGAHVRNDCNAIFGGSGIKASPPMPGAPTVRVRGFVGFGGVDVSGPKTEKQRDRERKRGC